LALVAVFQIDAVPHRGWFVGMIKSDILMVLLDPDINWMACLPNIDLTLLTGYNTYLQYLHS
jgi:hypothetical protein